MPSKTSMSAARSEIKIAELAKELNVDPREVVSAAKEMAMENAKVPASWVTGGQADRLRAKFGGNKDLKETMERRQRAVELGRFDEAEAESEKSPAHKGKKAPEDSRARFGVVQTASGVAVEPPAPQPEKKHARAHSAPAAKVETSTEPIQHNLLMPIPPAKKFLGVKVNEPVRREASAPDPRFGVVAPPPPPEKPPETAPPAKPLSNLWNMLNDGRPSIDMAAAEKADAPAAQEEIHEATPAEEEITTLQPIEEPPAEELPPPPPASRAAKAPAPQRVERGQEVEEEDDKDQPASSRTVHSPPAPRVHEVPHKRDPAHRAFGAKRKLKHKKHKVLQELKPERRKSGKQKAAQASTPAPAKKQSGASDRHAKSAPPQKKPEGILRRIARKILGK